MKELSFETLYSDAKVDYATFGSIIEDARNAMEDNPDTTTIIGKEITLTILRSDKPDIEQRAEMVVVFNKFIGMTFESHDSENDEPLTIAIDMVVLHDHMQHYMPSPDMMDYSNITKFSFTYHEDVELYALNGLVYTVKIDSGELEG